MACLTATNKQLIYISSANLDPFWFNSDSIGDGMSIINLSTQKKTRSKKFTIAYVYKNYKTYPPIQYQFRVSQHKPEGSICCFRIESIILHQELQHFANDYRKFFWRTVISFTMILSIIRRLVHKHKFDTELCIRAYLSVYWIKHCDRVNELATNLC